MAINIAAFTMVRNESVFLPIWLQHYGSAFGASHLFVIDDGSDDGCADNLGDVNVIRLGEEPMDEEQRSLTISMLLTELLAFYDVAVFSDVDEMLVVDPLMKLGLREYIERHAGEHTNAVGLNVTHNQFIEPAYSPSLGVLRQRRFVRFATEYCKQLIHRSPVTWMPGFHATNKPVTMGIGLYLFHLRALDYELSRQRVRQLQNRQWSKTSVEKNLSAQLRMGEQEYLGRMYEGDPEPFLNALPEQEFNQQIAKAAALKDAGVWIGDKVFKEIGSNMLRLPARFTDAIAPVVGSQTAMPDYGPSRVTGMTPGELHQRAREALKRSGIAYA